MSGTRLTIDPDSAQGLPRGRVDHEVLDATGEEDIARQARDDDAEAMRDMGRLRPPGAPASRAHPGRVRAAHRRASRDHPELGAGQAGADGCGPGIAQDPRQGRPETALRVLG